MIYYTSKPRIEQFDSRCCYFDAIQATKWFVASICNDINSTRVGSWHIFTYSYLAWMCIVYAIFYIMWWNQTMHRAPCIYYILLYAQCIICEHFICLCVYENMRRSISMANRRKICAMAKFCRIYKLTYRIPEWAKVRHVQFDPSNLPSFFSSYTYIHTLYFNSSRNVYDNIKKIVLR